MKYLDRIIILLALIGGGITAYLIFRPTTNDRPKEVAALANVGELMGEARVRREGLVGWRNLQEGETLYPKDSIISLDETFIRLDVKGGTSFNLTPNTLVYLVQDADAIDIDLQRGVLGMSLVNLKNRLLINVGKKKIEVKSNNAKMHVSLGDANDTNLTVIDGVASIVYKGNAIDMKKGERVRIDENTTKMDVTTFGIGPQRPGMDKIIFQEEGKSIDFEWDSRDASVEEFSVTTARDPQMKSIVSQVTTKEKKASLDIAEEGRYYWQVLGMAQNKVMAEAPVYSFLVKKESAPVLVYPGSNSVIELSPDEETTNVTLRWESQSAEKYEVEFFKYGIEKEKGELLSSDSSYVVVSSLDPKEYKWRVRAIDRQRTDNEWSEFRNFVVAEFKASDGQSHSGPRRRREFYEESTGEWKKKER
ncbi:MAG: hypothetical protein A2X86_00850 [Bdellovibrionales bacterium GWA2_49_15]|nr:MAG: hypothetical protein A2X86_00850 [Bdellovibrionales bacterium GWA2_49_15]HAZ14590.1 hypothetical protein [Bdellovibrionales bacterium]